MIMAASAYLPVSILMSALASIVMMYCRGLSVNNGSVPNKKAGPSKVSKVVPGQASCPIIAPTAITSRLSFIFSDFTRTAPLSLNGSNC